jgi:2,4-dienoyl-CoA reductase-like NADH-dependent reductase (Old Yellow Enzyme family)
MSCLFQPIDIGPVTVKNRFVRSATGEWMADKEGIIQDRIIPMYERISAGGVGLIITGHMYIHKDWPCHPRQTGIWSDKHLEGLRRMAEASRRNNTRAVVQINYVGRKPHEMTLDDIDKARDCFVAAAQRAIDAGFDGVQIHASHGYLLSCFLTPSENQRTDRYGDGPDGRRRLLLEVAELIVSRFASDNIVCCKLGCVDGRDNSLPLEETVETAKALEKLGLHALELSTTIGGEHAEPIKRGIDTVEKEAYLLRETTAVKEAVDIPVMQVGGLRTLSLMEQLVREHKCDMISLCRPFLREPGIVNAFRDGTSKRCACISCNKCLSRHGSICVFAGE